MWYPANGCIANGSRRSTPTGPSAAAVCSLPSVAPRKQPCSQLLERNTSGTLVRRRPPNRITSTGTPSGASQSGEIVGHWWAATVKRPFGWAAGWPQPGVQSLPCQSIRWDGAESVMPSHHTSPSSVSATLVKIVFSRMASIATGLVEYPVPGATPKKPYSGLMAYRRPSSPGRIQTMSSPIVSTFQPGTLGCIIARLVLPVADGNAPVMVYFSPCGLVT